MKRCAPSGIEIGANERVLGPGHSGPDRLGHGSASRTHDEDDIIPMFG